MVTGELLWTAVRARPDMSFAVSIMGQQVIKRPKWACQLGNHVLGFLKSSWDHCLRYSSEVGGHGLMDMMGSFKFQDIRVCWKRTRALVLPPMETEVIRVFWFSLRAVGSE